MKLLIAAAIAVLTFAPAAEAASVRVCNKAGAKCSEVRAKQMKQARVSTERRYYSRSYSDRVRTMRTREYFYRMMLDN